MCECSRGYERGCMRDYFFLGYQFLLFLHRVHMMLITLCYGFAAQQCTCCSVLAYVSSRMRVCKRIFQYESN